MEFEKKFKYLVAKLNILSTSELKIECLKHIFDYYCSYNFENNTKQYHYLNILINKLIYLYYNYYFISRELFIFYFENLTKINYLYYYDSVIKYSIHNNTFNSLINIFDPSISRFNNNILVKKCLMTLNKKDCLIKKINYRITFDNNTLYKMCLLKLSKLLETKPKLDGLKLNYVVKNDLKLLLK